VAYHQDFSDEQIIMVRITIDDNTGDHIIDKKAI